MCCLPTWLAQATRPRWLNLRREWNSSLQAGDREVRVNCRAWKLSLPGLAAPVGICAPHIEHATSRHTGNAGAIALGKQAEQLGGKQGALEGVAVDRLAAVAGPGGVAAWERQQGEQWCASVDGLALWQPGWCRHTRCALTAWAPLPSHTLSAPCTIKSLMMRWKMVLS